MAKRYRNQTRGNPFARMWNDQVKAALGCDPKKHWPDAGVGGAIDGHTVLVLPKGWTIRKNHAVKATSSMARRTYVLCEHCAHPRWVCCGHFGQHLAAHHADL